MNKQKTMELINSLILQTEEMSLTDVFMRQIECGLYEEEYDVKNSEYSGNITNSYVNGTSGVSESNQYAKAA